MIARLVLLLVLSLLSPSTVIAAEKKSETADDFLRRGLLTKDQHALLRYNEFLTIKCGDKPSSCVPQINFMGGECGTLFEFIKQPEKYKAGATPLIYNISELGIRVKQYPAALRAFRKWDASAEKEWTELKEIYSKAVAIANSNSRRADKLRQAEPLLKRAEEISAAMAKSAGFEYDSGCGADEEDSQIVGFSFPEKPKAALYILQGDFDACKRVLNDPYNTKNCESWRNIQPSNELSGNYRYRVTWSDGHVSEKPFSALSRGRKTIEIVR
jgi:hypothetical protein